jgi:hypothetical protein
VNATSRRISKLARAVSDSGRSYYSDTDDHLLDAIIEAVTGQTHDRA